MSTENIALRLMKGLRKEWEREPSLLKCRTVGVVATEIGISQSHFDRAMKFITSKSMIDASRRDDGLAAHPNDIGLAWIDGHKEKWSPEARLALWALIFTILCYGVPRILSWLLP